VSRIASEPEEPLARDTCYRCFRPNALCLCAAIPAVDNRTPIVILQHPRERTHPFNTARLAALGLSRVEVLVDHLGRLRQDPRPLRLREGDALLYPGPTARDINSLAPGEHPRRLFVIDGTWHHARTLYRDIPAVAALPHLTLPDHLRSAFAIRKQPAVYCLSTIEAIVFALRALEPETPELDRLLEAFGAMQGQQLSLMRGAGRQRKPTRQRESRAIPRALIEGYRSLVVAYGETTFDANARGHRRLLCCTAERPATGERFRRVLKHPGVTDDQLQHLGLSRTEVEAGATFEAFQAEWRGFIGAGEGLAAWNHATLDLLCTAAELPRTGVALKGVYHNLKRHRGSLEDIVAREALDDSPGPPPAGRAERRLRNAVRLAKFLHQRGSGHAASTTTP
jgi:DTW domain-containing protein YfiP